MDDSSLPDLNRRRLLLAGSGLLLVPVAGCGGGGGGDTTMANAPGMGGGPSAPTAAAALQTGAPFRAPAVLANSAGTVGSFAATLTAAPVAAQLAASGAATTVWAFNGISPGPMIDVREGDTVTIVFRNQLSQASTIHWHGLPVPPDQDGNPMDPVAPGASRTYNFTLPAGSAGTYWYHPHPHETTHEQVFRGLAGSLIVRPAADPLGSIAERVLVITDLRLDAANQIAANTVQDNLFGREGDHLLVNGLKQPVVAVQAGATERWRIINASNARYLRLALAGHTVQVISHGAGLIERPQTVNEILLAPAQRVELLVQISALSNRSFALTAGPYTRGMMMSASAAVDVLQLNTSLAGVAAPVVLPATFAAVAELPAPVRTQIVSMGDSMGMGMGAAMGMSNQFLINGRSFDPARVDLVSRVGVTEDWLVANQGAMDHPFHIHGNQFQLVGSTRTDTTPGLGYRAWIDTINVRGGETVRLRVRQAMAGKRMFHCHILEHEDQGMMAVLDVQP